MDYNGKNVYIGDSMAAEVRLGKNDGTGYVVSQANNTYIRRYLDASGKTLFAGWNGNKVVLGNNAKGASTYVDTVPKDTVVSGNDLYVYGNTTATNQLCINKTCINEADLIRMKSK